MVLPAVGPFTWLNCVCWRWSCSEFQLSLSRTSDKPLSVQAIAHFTKFSKAPSNCNRTLQPVSDAVCHSRESLKTNMILAPFGKRTSTPDLPNAWERMPLDVPPPSRPSHLSDRQQIVHCLHHSFVVAHSVHAHCTSGTHMRASHSFASSSNLLSRSLCTKSSEPIRVPRILMPSGSHTSSPIRPDLEAVFRRDSTRVSCHCANGSLPQQSSASKRLCPPRVQFGGEATCTCKQLVFWSQPLFHRAQRVVNAQAEQKGHQWIALLTSLPWTIQCFTPSLSSQTHVVGLA